MVLVDAILISERQGQQDDRTFFAFPLHTKKDFKCETIGKYYSIRIPDGKGAKTGVPPIPELSPRQLEILQSITRGLTTPDIAKQLGISAESVKMHSSILFSKLGASNRTEAVAIALRKHLLKI